MTRGYEVTLDRASAGELADDDGFWDLYDSAFPAAEREPHSVIVESVRRGVGLAVRARADGATVGLATTHLLSSVDATFLVYLATSRERRNQGVAPRLVDEVVRAAPPTIVWEVDAPALATSPDERLLRERRIRFFKRLGGDILLPSYWQPPVNGDAPVPMILMARGYSDSRGTLERLVRAMYFEKYGAANGVDSGVLERLLHLSFSKE